MDAVQRRQRHAVLGAGRRLRWHRTGKCDRGGERFLLHSAHVHGSVRPRQAVTVGEWVTFDHLISLLIVPCRLSALLYAGSLVMIRCPLS